MTTKRVTFSVYTPNGKVEFLHLNEITDTDLTEQLRNVLVSWDQQVKTIAVKHSLRDKIGEEPVESIKIIFKDKKN